MALKYSEDTAWILPELEEDTGIHGARDLDQHQDSHTSSRLRPNPSLRCSPQSWDLDGGVVLLNRMSAPWRQVVFPSEEEGLQQRAGFQEEEEGGVRAAETLASLESNPFILTAGQAWHCVWKAFLGRALFDWQTGFEISNL